MITITIHSAEAADIETLFMPGKVIQDHAEFESECSKCHSRFKKATQTQLCLDCHEDIAADLQSEEGFHGRNKKIKNANCKSCHTEHIGRGADIVLLNRATFDHELTDFALKGAHTSVSCNACHEPDKRYAEAANTCFDCHEKQEPHKGNLGKKCGSCHTPKAWDELDYDHDKTDFPLKGKHQDVSCHSCHINEQYEDIPQECNACHYLNDIHNGRNGTECEDCHSPKKWDESKFDHERDTDFPLHGKHKDISCEACHIDPVADKKPPEDCYTCHKNDDQHQGRNGKKCQSCHNEIDWKRSRFNHDKKTDFPLKGKHKDLICAACHRGDLYKEELSTECVDCHKGDDAHKGQQGDKCSQCHQEIGWSKQVIFDHDLTKFPLLGLHASTPCEECHLSSEFKNTAIKCYACHQQDDTHKLSLGPKCEQCHNPNAWALWEFDHNTQTDFKLDGAHEDLSCEQCHITPTKSEVKQSSNCHACHEQDDEHRGRFGRNCQRCHTTESFSDVNIRR